MSGLGHPRTGPYGFHRFATARPGRLFIDAAVVFTATGIAAFLGAATIAHLSEIGWRYAPFALICFGLIAAVALAALPRHPHPTFGAANVITTVRSGIAALIGALIFEGDRLADPIEPGLAWTVSGGAAIALILDAFDGYAARRQHRCSDFGARFDMEVDALLILFLSVLAYASGKAGMFVILLGAMRYLYLALHALVPSLPDDLPPSLRRKAVCVVQVVALCAITAPILAPQWTNLIATLALATLSYSFAVDVARQLQAGRQESGRQGR